MASTKGQKKQTAPTVKSPADQNPYRPDVKFLHDSEEFKLDMQGSVKLNKTIKELGLEGWTPAQFLELADAFEKRARFISQCYLGFVDKLPASN